MPYLKWKVKSLNQVGGNDEDKLVKKIFSNGNIFYYSNKGKLLLNSGNPKDANDKISELILKKQKKFKNKELIAIKLIDWEMNNHVPARIGITIYIMKVSFISKDKLALPIRDKKQSNISIYLRPEEFDFGLIKKCSKLALDKKLVDNINYTYESLSKMLYEKD